MLKRLSPICIAALLALQAPAPVIAQARSAGAPAGTLTDEQIKTVLDDITQGRANPLFTTRFSALVASKAAQLRADLGNLYGRPRGVHPEGNGRYMAFYYSGFVEWELVTAPDGLITAASYRITDDPGTPARTANARDQTGVYGFWTAATEVAVAYSRQQEANRQAEMAFTSAVLARIEANGGYASSGSGVGATGSLMSPETYAGAQSEAGAGTDESFNGGGSGSTGSAGGAFGQAGSANINASGQLDSGEASSNGSAYAGRVGGSAATSVSMATTSSNPPPVMVDEHEGHNHAITVVELPPPPPVPELPPPPPPPTPDPLPPPPPRQPTCTEVHGIKCSFVSPQAVPAEWLSKRQATPLLMPESRLWKVKPGR